MYEPRFLAGSGPSNRIGKWCIYGVSFIVATCTLVFPQYGVVVHLMFVNTLKSLQRTDEQILAKVLLTAQPLAVLTLETDHKSEKGYPLDNTRQTDNTSKFENETVLIEDKQCNPPDFVQLFICQF